MQLPGHKMYVSTLNLTEKGAGRNLFPHTMIPVAVRERLHLQKGASPLYFQHYAAEGLNPFHIMQEGALPESYGPYRLQKTGAIALPPSFVEPGDRHGQPQKLVFLERDNEAMIVGRVEHVMARLGQVALAIGDERIIGGLIVANFSNRSLPELTGVAETAIDVPFVSEVVRHAFPDVWE